MARCVIYPAEMKRRSGSPLRAKQLDTEALKRTHGGRGIVRGYIECNACSATIPPDASVCPNCYTSVSEDIPEIPFWYVWG